MFGPFGWPWQWSYHASKFALVGMGESLSHEVHRQGIRVSVILPGGVRTEALNKIDAELVSALKDPRNGAIGSYSEGIERLRRLITQSVQLAASPEAVASRVAAAISSDQQR